MNKFSVFLCILALLTLCGCETLRGFGKDLQKAGNWVEDQAKQ